jgi:N-glycosylase/DNA lyase
MDFYAFPTILELSKKGVSEKLRQLGFGYRAKFIHESAIYLSNQNEGINWLYNLRKLSYEEAHQSLRQLSGIGPKVADCICLMSLDKLSAIPVDTHVWQIALRDYGLKSKGIRNLTPKTYLLIRQIFQSIFGPLAGWAHTVNTLLFFF